MPRDVPPETLEALVVQVRRNPKYRAICESVIRQIGRRALLSQPRLKEAVKATRNKLHQIGGAYFTRPPDYVRWLEWLRKAHGDPDRLRRVCQEILKTHASTRERLPILERFYGEILGEIGPVRTVLDLACGLNPLAIPWTGLSPETRYLAVDMYADLADFLNAVFPLLGISGWAECRNVLEAVPMEPFDLALLLKALPCLEQITPGASEMVLGHLNARHVLISFPVHSLSGAEKGMRTHYEKQFGALIGSRSWRVRRFEFATELAFLLERLEPSGRPGQ